MIRTHDKDHEKLLEQITCGDLERDHPELLALLEDCPECRDRLDGLESVAELLAAAAHEQRETLDALEDDAAAPESDLPGVDVVGPFIRARLAERRRARWLRYAAAAAVIASAGGGWWAVNRSEPAPAPVLLGSDALHFTGLQQGALALGAVQWEFDLPPGGWYEVELLDALGAALTPTERLQQSEWIPSPEEEEKLPDEFRMRVTAYDTYGQFVDSASVSVLRSR